jgi:hypothetical protein
MANLDITVARGADWVKTLTVEYRSRLPVNIGDGSTWAGEIKNPNATQDTVAATFTFAVVTNGSDGMIRMTLTDDQSLLLRKDRLYAYDVFATILGRRYRVLWGNVDLQPNITTP